MSRAVTRAATLPADLVRDHSEALLRELNDNFARWVAAQRDAAPDADWSNAALEYAGYVAQIKSGQAARHNVAAKGTAGDKPKPSNEKTRKPVRYAARKGFGSSSKRK